MKDTIYIIDGYGLIYRSYFAFINSPRINPDGENASAVFGFFRTLFSLLKARNPGYLAVVMDSRVPTFRHEKYPAYKEKRQPTPLDLHAQVPRIEKLLAALGVPVFQQDRFEADDIIAAIAGWCSSRQLKCLVYSKDKDLFQLVGEYVSILYPAKSPEFEEWGRAEVFQNKGVYPEQMADFLALTGDSSDNIPGVAGIGEKTAAKLFAEYGSLDSIYAHLAELKSASQQRKLADGRELAYFCRELIQLNHAVPLNFSLEAFRLGQPDQAQLAELFHREGIRAFDAELGGEASAEAAAVKSEQQRGSYTLITQTAQLDSWLKQAREAGIFAFDIETDNIDAMLAVPIGFSFTAEAGKACYVPIRAAGVECLPEDTLRQRLKPLLEDSSLKLVGQNFKYDYKVLSRWGIRVGNLYFDTMLAAWVLDSTANSYNMDKLAELHLGYNTIHYSDLISKKEELTLADIGIARVVDYAGEDADITFRLYELFREELAKTGNEKLSDLFHNVEMPLVTVLAEMELAGVKLLPEQLKVYSRELAKELTLIEHEIYKECGHEFNIRSTKELQVILFEERGLKPVKKTKTGNSTDAQVLEILAAEDTVVEKILHHRLLSKLKSTYVDTLPQLVHPVTGRIHTSFLQTGTATGRLSSNNPNLQNIPVREKAGRRIRAAFVPEAGCFFLSADYSQIELVLLAHLADEKNLSEAFRNNRDVHRHTAAVLFGVREEDVTPEQRRIGKTINFGVIYGMSAFRLSRDLKIPRKEAERFIETYFTEYSGVNAYKNRVIETAEQNGYVETLLGRRRKLHNISSRNKTVKMADERIAVNTPIQGSAADIVKLAMLKIAAELEKKKLKSRLLLQVHDELILEVPEAELAKVQKLVKEIMEHIHLLNVPLQVNMEVRKGWDQIH